MTMTIIIKKILLDHRSSIVGILLLTGNILANNICNSAFKNLNSIK